MRQLDANQYDQFIWGIFFLLWLLQIYATGDISECYDNFNYHITTSKLTCFSHWATLSNFDLEHMGSSEACQRTARSIAYLMRWTLEHRGPHVCNYVL